MGHGALDLLIAAGNHDSVIDIRAHLDRADHKVTHEKHAGSRKGRNGEVDPDAALNDYDQQKRHTGGFERKEQYHQHDEQRHDADHSIVTGKGFFKIVFRGGIARHINISIRVIALRRFPNGIKEGVGLVAAFRQRQIQQHPAVILALKLRLGALHLGFCILQHGGLVAAKLYNPGVCLLTDKQEHINERHLVGADISHKLAVISLLCGVGGIEHLRHFIVEIGQFRELPGHQLVGQHIAVHGLHVGKPHGVVDLLHAFQFCQ